MQKNGSSIAFKIGDRIRVKADGFDRVKRFSNETGTIVSINSKSIEPYDICVEFDRSIPGTYCPGNLVPSGRGYLGYIEEVVLDNGWDN